ncbi:MFS transporter [Actinomadura sp. WMMB 499]|uniref:MFS transporter n=1 Tax=Actinomadura sp. WMMB 499 TaxID=1219491 RepID=UPI00159EA717|nr:MFS transporter [Actinomadura sp. WMMB 499]
MPGRNHWWPVVGCGLVIFMATLDTSIVAVALPELERDFGVATAATEWVVLGYLLPLIALTLPAGRWLDRTGPRAALLLAVAGFALASVAAGLAPGLAWLVGARLVQGAFAGLLFAVIPMVVVRSVPPDVAGRASALVMTLGPLGAVSGPPLGGVITEFWGWPWIFYINVPVAVLVVAIALRTLPPDALRPPDRAFAGETLLLGAAATALLLSLSFTATHGLGWLALAPAAVPVLAAWWRTSASGPVRALVRTPASGPVAAVLLNALAISLVEFLAPFYLQETLGLSPLGAAAAILAMPVAMVLGGPVGGLLGDRWGTVRTSVLGLAVAGLGGSLLVFAGDGWHPAELSWRLALIGLGTGLFAGPCFATIMSGVPPELQGSAGAAQSLARQLGFSLGPALATAAWALSGYTLGGLRGAFAIGAVATLAALPLLARDFPHRKVRATFPIGK